jgi:hypothetical protein
MHPIRSMVLKPRKMRENPGFGSGVFFRGKIRIRFVMDRI